MIYAIYIAAAAIVGVLIGLVILSIAWLRKSVSNNIRSKTTELISVYDELLEEKSSELAALTRQEEALPGRTEEPLPAQPAQEAQPAAAMRASELLNIAERAGGAVYRDDTIGSMYLKIRENFSFRLEELLAAVSGAAQEMGGTAARLLKCLDYDTVYRLSTMFPEEQINILRETLPTEGITLLEAYIERNRTFCALRFYDHLQALADAEPKPIRLRVPAGMAPVQMMRAGVEIIPDEEICEGFQMEADRVLYDYCIKAKELR